MDYKTDRNLFEIRRWLIEDSILHSKESGISTNKLVENGNVIVSLTSYGQRLSDVAYTIESIMRQSIKPNRIILWIDTKDEENIPVSLQLQRKRGLEIYATNDEIRSYKKLIHTLDRYPNDTIITIDDDVIYEFDLIEHLLKAHYTNPKDICAARVHRITYGDDGVIKPYNSWNWTITQIGADENNFLTGIGGVLYPPNSLAKEVTNSNLFLKLAPTADDVWFYYMAKKNNTLIRKVETRNKYGNDYVENLAYNDQGLLQINTKGECLNDKQIHNVKNYFNL